MDFDKLELDRDATSPEPGQSSAPAPFDGPSFYAAARALRRNGRMLEAARAYDRALGFREHDFWSWIEGADCLLRAGQLADALAWAQRAIDGHRQTRLLYASLALMHAATGDIPQAFKVSDISLDVERPWYPVCVRGELLLRMKAGSKENLAQAITCFEEAVGLAEDPWDALFIAGCALFDARWPAHAAGFFAEAAHQAPLGAAAWLGLADCFHALALHEQAAFYCDRALEIEPYLQPAYQRRVSIRGKIFGLMRGMDEKLLKERWEREFNIARPKPTRSSFIEE